MAGHLFSNARLPSNNLDRRLVRALGSVSVGIFSKIHGIQTGFMASSIAFNLNSWLSQSARFIEFWDKVTENAE